jgi:Macrocin-O-methyltransferase (TylF)
MEKKTSELYGGQGVAIQDVWAQVQAAVEQHGIPLRDVLESFAIYARRINITRFLAHYEMYKMVQDIPGCIVECGVYQGNSLFAFAKFLEIFSPGDRIRHVIGFDSFKGFEQFSPEDGPEYPNRSKVLGGWNPADFKECFFKFVDIYHADQFVPHSKRVFVVEGDVSETVPRYVEEHPGLRISLLHLDIDLYQPTRVALDHLYPRVVPGGLVVLDEYGMTEWGGESKAFEDYFGQKPPRIRKFPWTSTPGGFFVKGVDTE